MALLLATATISCGGSDHGPSTSVVMVIDQGFDTTAAALDGQVLAGFTVKCRDIPAAAPVDAPDLASRRSIALEAMRASMSACRLEPGISPKEPLLQDVLDLQEKWNAAVANDDGFSIYLSRDDFGRISDALDRELEAKPFHGTATAGVIAGEDSNIKVVLVERELGSNEAFESSFECIKQTDLDNEVQLFNDPEFQAGLMALPTNQVDADIDRVVKEQGVQIINESFGQPPRPAIQELLSRKQCPAVDLKPYFTATAKLDRLWDQAHPGPDVITVISAGNEGVEVNDETDYSPCGAAGMHVFVGSYVEFGRHSEFSNFGNCVDVFAQGENVVAPIPGGWSIPLAGTSFSAPLVARWLATHNQTKELSLKARRELLLGLRNEERDLPADFAPPKLIYDPFRVERSVVSPDMTIMQRKRLLHRRFASSRGRLPLQTLLGF